jgi:hypothetical protein
MNDEHHSQTNSSNFEKHVKEKLIQKKKKQVVTFDNMPDYSVQRYCFDFRDTRFPVMPL